MASITTAMATPQSPLTRLFTLILLLLSLDFTLAGPLATRANDDGAPLTANPMQDSQRATPTNSSRKTGIIPGLDPAVGVIVIVIVISIVLVVPMFAYIYVRRRNLRRVHDRLVREDRIALVARQQKEESERKANLKKGKDVEGLKGKVLGGKLPGLPPVPPPYEKD